ncbi:hypothetical protein FB106_11232 [Synechococcus sp. Ace-Pa]|nr:hypothetical protein FB106_11232 [Synechococcus sp. Ace-Pa]
MGQRPNCRSCRHCIAPLGGEPGWCQLRRLAIHSELSGDLWCHHWTARSGRPSVEPVLAQPISFQPYGHRQLSLVGLLEPVSQEPVSV